jgi:hypothetical protein
MRRILFLTLAMLLAPIAAEAKSWSIVCSANSCAAIDDAGNVAYIDLGKQTVVGVDKLSDNPSPPFVVSCGAGDACVVVDGTGKLRFGPAKPGAPFKPALDAKLP